MHVKFGKTFCFVGLCSIFGLSGTTQAMAAAPDANAVNEVREREVHEHRAEQAQER